MRFRFFPNRHLLYLSPQFYNEALLTDELAADKIKNASY